jgi:serine-type D-Ala-D-Ala endopeptidase (penicillin-binding protein 7)
MSDVFHKLAFLGVMIVVVVFSNRGTVAEEPLRLTYGGAQPHAVQNPPPIFVLQDPSRVLGNLEGSISENSIAGVPKEASAVPAFADEAQNTSLEALPSRVGGFPTSSFIVDDTRVESIFHKSGSGSPPEISARIALVADLQSGERYLRLNDEKQWPLASLTKLTAAAVAIRYGTLTEKATVTQRAFAADPTEQNIKVGGIYRISDLLKLMLLPSSNVAAETVAEFYGRDAFIAAMNAQAKEWDLQNINFDDPSGISISNQSTAENVLLLAQGIARDYPEVFRIGREPSATIAEWNENYEFTIKSINKFAGRPDFVGGKTGYTDEAGGNLISVFSYEGRSIVIIILGATTADQRFSDTEKLLEWFKGNYKQIR